MYLKGSAHAGTAWRGKPEAWHAGPGAAGVGWAVLKGGSDREERQMTALNEAAAPAGTKSLTVLGACPQDCPDTCSMVVTVEDGVATRVAGNKDMPFTDGGL